MKWTSSLDIRLKGKKAIIMQVMFFAASVLCARAELYYGIRPFGIALVCASSLCGIPMLPLAVGSMLGTLTLGIGARSIFMYILPLLLIDVIILILQRKNVRLNVYKCAIIVVLAHIIPAVAVAMTTYDRVIYIINTVSIIIMFMVMKSAIDIIMTYSSRRHIAGEDIICLTVSGAVLIIGIGDLNLFGVSLQRTTALIMVLLAANSGGVGAGAAAGCLLGFLQAMQLETAPYLTAVLGLCGVVSGAFVKLKRIGVGIAFLLAYVLITLSFEGYILPTLPIVEILIALAVFMLIPKKLINELSQLAQGGGANLRSPKFYIRQTKSQVSARLKEMGRIFEEMAQMLQGEVYKQGRKANTNKIVNMAARHVCADCMRKIKCKELREVKQGLVSLAQKLAYKTEVGYEDIDEALRENCIRVDEVLQSLNHVRRVESERLILSEKSDDERRLVSQQLLMVSQIMRSMAEDTSGDTIFDDELERAIREDLDEAGVPCREVLVQRDSDGKLVVNIVKNACEHERQCIDKCEPIISKACGRPMISCEVSCNNACKGLCALQYIDAPKFSVVTGVAVRPKSNSSVSGDNYTVQGLERDRYMIALSDGMGSGQRAAAESEAAIGLIESFYLAGFKDDIVINTINKLLLMRDNDEMYATLDLCIIDRTMGRADFIKIGAIQGYIKRDHKVNTIVPQAVPLGIMENVNPASLSIELKDGDIIVMITDGISECVSKEEDLIAVWLSQINSTNPQSIADAIMKRCLKLADGLCKDDMTVIVTKVQSSASGTVRKLRRIS